jgi:hypothetical protein
MNEVLDIFSAWAARVYEKTDKEPRLVIWRDGSGRVDNGEEIFFRFRDMSNLLETLQKRQASRQFARISN